MNSNNDKVEVSLLNPVNSSFEDTELINYFDDSTEEQDKIFHTIIGHIEEIIMDKTFLTMLNEFMDTYYEHFDHNEENKLIYTDIFRKYQNTIEKYIEEKLEERVENFDMKKFENELMKRKSELDGEIFEILATFSDFLEFKGMFLDYKKMKEGSSIDLSNDIHIQKYEIKIS